MKQAIHPPAYYDSKNIIDMSEYVSFLADGFRKASEAGRERVCIQRLSRAFAATIAADYASLDKTIDLIQEVSSKVIASKTQSPIADRYLFASATILKGTNAKEDERLKMLILFER